MRNKLRHGIGSENRTRKPVEAQAKTERSQGFPRMTIPKVYSLHTILYGFLISLYAKASARDPKKP